MDFTTWTTGERFLADGDLIRRRIGAKADIPEGWRLPTLAEIRELREKCIQSAQEKDGQEWIVFTGKNGNSISFLYPIGSRSALRAPTDVT